MDSFASNHQTKTNNTMSTIKLVVLDMAGTTVHDNDDVNICFQAALESTGLNVTRDDINAVMGLRKPEAIKLILETKLADKSAITDAYVNELHDVFLAKMIDFYKNDPRVKEVDGASDVFRALREKGIKVGIDSGFSRDIMDTIIERLGWDKAGLIDVSVASDEVTKGRPAPFMIEVMMTKLGIDEPAAIAKVGDTPADLGEGFSAKCGLNIGILSGACTREELEPHPHTHLVNSITDITDIILNHN